MKLLYRATVFIFFITLLLSCKTIQKSTGIEKTVTQQAMFKALQWQEANPIFAKAPTDWTNGAYYVGVVKAHESTVDNAYLEALQAMAIRNEWKPWQRFYHADDITITYSYLYLKSIGAKGVNLQPTDTILIDHLFKPHEWRAGTLTNEQKILWWWCDALFMAPPVLAKYAKLNNDISYLKEMDKYYAQTYELLYDKKKNFLPVMANFYGQEK